MPDKPKLPNVGPKLPTETGEIEDFNTVVDYYHVVLGFEPDEALEQATKDYNRGPTSPIYQHRVKQAIEWDIRHQKFLEEKTNRERVANGFKGEPDYPAAPYDPAMNPYGAGAPPPNPEGAMANPALWNPKGLQPVYKHGAPPQPAAVTQPSPESAMADPAMWNPYNPQVEAAYAEAFKRYQQAQMGVLQHTPQAPVSPAPLNPAAPTPAHLEDANLSSWQSLADLLGYGQNSPFPAMKRR